MSILIVSGAGGQLGRHVLGHLLDTLQVPADRIIATSRHPGGPLSDWAGWRRSPAISGY